MNTFSRKQREIAQRHELILDAAEQLLSEYDYSSLTMEKVAAEIEYAKGTVYQHFTCKEDLLCALCLRHFELMQSLFLRAVRYDGNTRDRMSAVLVAYQLFFRLHRHRFTHINLIKTHHIRDKVSEDMQAKLMHADVTCMQIVGSVTEAAIEQGDLVLDEMSVPEFLYGLWSSAFGGLMLASSDIPMDKLGVADTSRTLRNHMTKVLDGYQWQPLSKDYDVHAVFKAIEERVFAEEFQALDA